MDAGKNFSSRRQAVYECLKASKAHPSADMVYEECRKSVPSISLATVYRNLALLEESGEIIRVGGALGKERFDGDTSPHMHMVCTRCGDICDIFREDIAQYAAERCRELKYSGYSLTFYGLCDKCKGED